MDRDKILVPPNWDSRGKIRVIREGFDVEGTSAGWSIDIQFQHVPPTSSTVTDIRAPESTANDEEDAGVLDSLPEGSVIPSYESTVQNPHAVDAPKKPTIEVPLIPTQTFLAEQQEIMNQLKAQEDAAAAAEAAKADEQEREQSTLSNSNDNSTVVGGGKRPRTDAERIALLTRLPPNSDAKKLQEQIGPVQFNVGGIEVDAEDMVARMQKRRNAKTDDLDSGASTPVRNNKGAEERNASGSGGGVETPDSKSNEALSNFFTDLLKRGGTGSPRTPGSGRKGGGGKREGSSMRDVRSAGSDV